MRTLIDRFSSPDESGPCSCDSAIDDGVLVVDAADCDGDLSTASDCRERVIRTLADRDADEIVVRSTGLERHLDGRGVALLSAAGRFVDLAAGRDDRLASLAAIDPLETAQEVAARAGPVADIAAETGLALAAEGVSDYESVLSPTVGLAITHYLVETGVDDGARLRDVVTLETGSETRIYDRPDAVPRYALDVVDLTLSADERSILADAYEAIANGDVGGDRAASRAIEYVTDDGSDDSPSSTVTSVLAKHTRGYGVLEDLFSDPRVSDVYVTAPVATNPVRVVVDGESMATNLRLTPDGAGALASRVRRTSGRAFSRANPTVDATARLDCGTDVRIAGVTDPVADGVSFAFREGGDDRFTLPALVANGTMSADAAAFLSVAIERNAATLVAGTRGAGKTTLLGTLLYELPVGTRTVVIEDTPELPVTPLQAVDRDVQALRTGTGDGLEISAADALKTALRLGDGALVVGEVRGEEARVLYEAMRVGANANAVLGTIHGDRGEAVYERVVSDLEVPPSSFGATNLVVTVQAYRTPTGRERRLASIEEVIAGENGIRFEPLYELDGEDCVATGRIARGESPLVESLAGPTESYADVRGAIDDRRELLANLAADGLVAPTEVAGAYAHRGEDTETW